MLQQLKYLIKNNPTPSKSGYEYKMQHSFEKRKEESTLLKQKYPDKIPVIIEKSDTSLIQTMEKQKILLQKDITIGQFLYIIRKQIKLESTEALFLFVDNRYIPQTSKTISEIYNLYADKDGFLYITYSPEQTYG